MICCAVRLAGKHVGARVGDGDSGAAGEFACPDEAAVAVQAILHAVGPHTLTGILLVTLTDDAFSHGHRVGGASDGDFDGLLAGGRGVDSRLEVHVCGLEVAVTAEGGGDICGDLAVERIVGDGALADVLLVGTIEGGGLESHLIHACGHLKALAQANREGCALRHLLAGVVHVDLYGRADTRLVILAGGAHAVDLNAAGGGRCAAIISGDVVAGTGRRSGGRVVGGVFGSGERRRNRGRDNAHGGEGEERDGLCKARALRELSGQDVSFCVDGEGDCPLAPCFRGKPICALSVFQAHFLVFVGALGCVGRESGCFATKTASLMPYLWLSPPHVLVEVATFAPVAQILSDLTSHIGRKAAGKCLVALLAAHTLCAQYTDLLAREQVQVHACCSTRTVPTWRGFRRSGWPVVPIG